MKEAAEFAESTQILMNVSEFTDVSTATDTLISAVQAFGYTAETSMEVVDLMNIIGNNYAISTADLATSLTKSSASLVAAGGNLAEAAALTATANAIIQDADSVGTALKTTSLRLRGTSVKVLEEEGLDSDGAIESTSKLRSQVLATSGVDILTDTGAYKSTYQILLEIAEVWDKITDDKARAGLLELLAGKRNSSVIAALLQNPEDLKAAYEDAMDAEGSATKELEKYLDSIQGKIDQFNNALQTMWSNTLDSDWVKGFVAFGTEIIKIIDKIGLLNSALIALATISMIKNKMGPIAFLGGISDIIRDLPGKIVNFAKSFVAIPTAATASAKAIQGLTVASFQQSLASAGVAESNQAALLSQMGLTEANAAHVIGQQTLNASTLAAAVNNGTLTAAQAAQLASTYGLTGAIATLSATQMSEALTTAGVTSAQSAQIISTLGLSTASKALSADQVVQALTSAGVSTAQAGQIVSALGLTAANTGLAASFMALWTAMWPVLVVMLAIAAVVGIVKLFDAMITTTAELQEELDGMKSSLSDIRSELDSVNQELETTNERMAELLAKDSLTFVEQEELDKLKETNAELERRKNMLEAQEEYERERVGRQAAEVVNSKREEIGWWLNGKSEEEEVYDDIDEYLEVQKEIEEIEKKLANKKLSSSQRDDLNEELSDLKEDLDEEKADVSEYIDVLTEALSGVEYGDSEESDAALDYYHELLGYWNVKQGTPNAKSSEIKSVLNKKEFSNISNEIDKYVEALKGGDESAAAHIEKIIKNNSDLTKDLKARGVEIQDAVDYFTQLGQEANFATLEGKIAEMQTATSKMQTLLSDTKSADFTSLFDEDGEVSETAIAEYFKGTSEATRAEIARLVKDINDGEISVENALKQFELFGIESTLDIQIKEVQTNFKDVFVDLEDADGLISTFEELGEAIGSTVGALDAFNKAQGEMDYSGRVSIQTALELMQYTDDYGSVLEVVDGKLRLTEDAEENLINARITAMKVSAQTALADAQAAYEKAKLATQTYNDALTTDMSASVVASAWEKVLAAGAGLVEGIKSLFTDESWTEAYNRAYNETLSNMTGYETTYDDAGLQALVDAEAEAAQAVKNAQGNVNLLNGVTADNIGDLYESDDIEDPEDAAKTKLEELMEDFQKEMDYWENRIGANQARYEQIQNEIDLLGAKGQKAGSKYYQEQIKLENERENLLLGQKQAAEDYLEMLEYAGQKGSEEWWEVANTLNDIEGELDDVTASIQDLNDAMADTHWYMFDEAHDRVSTLTSDLENIRDILSNEKLFDDEGNFTKEGLGTLASYIQELGIYEGAMADARKEMELFGDAYDPNKTYVDAYGNNLSIDSEQDWYDAAEKAEEKYDEWNQKVIETRYNIKDLYEQQIDAVEEYTSTLVENYQDYIDVVKEALDSERDLYEFKKSTEQKSKNIASIERRIASLSGSTNAADVAERRKLQAELTDAKSDMDDHYYSHAKEQQSQALDDEATAYEAAMNAFIESLHTKLEESTAGLYMSYEEMSTETKSFVDGVTESVVLNAGNVKEVYLDTGETIDDCLMTPWTNAAAAIGIFASSEGALGLMNSWTEAKAGAPFYDFQTKVSGYLSKPWSTIIADGGPVKTFKTSVNSIMSQIVSDVQSNVSGISGVVSGLQTEINKIKDTTIRITTVYETQGDHGGGGPSGGGSGSGSGDSVTKTPEVKLRGLMKTSREMILGSKSFVDANTETINGVKYYRDSKTGYYYKISDLNSRRKYDGGRTTGWAIPKGTWFYTKHAKGTTGTTRDQWAITDEPQFGDELVLVPGKDGNLSFMRKGTGVVPADMTQKLFELAQIPTSDLMNKNLTAIVPNITKNDFKNEFNFESLVHVDTVDSDTLPKLEKMVDKKIDDFSKALNYSIKRFAR